MATSEVSNAGSSGGIHATQAATGSAATAMLQIQLLVAEDFDDQIKHIGEQMDKLSAAKDKMRARLNTLSSFMAMPVDNSRKDQQAVIWASPDQLSNFLGALETTDVNLETLETTDKPVMLNDRGTDHVFDEMSSEQIWNETAGYAHGDNAKVGSKTPETQPQVGDGNRIQSLYSPEVAQTGGQLVNKPQKDYSGQGPAIENVGGQSSAAGWETEMRKCADMTDPGVAMAFAENIPGIGKKGDDAGSLPFYFDKGNKNSKDSEGRPVFCILRSSIEEYKTILSNKLSSLDEKSEKLTNRLSQLMKQREQAMQSAMQTAKKEEEIKSGALSKLNT